MFAYLKILDIILPLVSIHKWSHTFSTHNTCANCMVTHKQCLTTGNSEIELLHAVPKLFLQDNLARCTVQRYKSVNPDM